ncbi:class I SAM-dependent methyltransferase [Streptomyces sp. DSM 44915]|uniref:Class I SAM-dependent methyltransferase n=1 Tax=Streptomyces chisholmiae TaxID=3075540 RepID=A0ABU2JNH4_9ACTN|nr:class I SAM-dependent methyltransferase [Streptomyces sp. DSM 44915]MDT0266538.1 class I SAM-dependent methyltransferase [Streptomyces sp. DSM 44915]
MDDWQWDETLFAGAAPYYRRGRLPYAPGLAAALGATLRWDGTGRLLDVGCGPGVLALRLAHHFRTVVGVDPDAGMIAEAGRLAAEAGVAGKTRWVRARAERLPADLGTFTVVAFAQSFHWMDRDLVAARARDLLRPGGVLLHVSDLKGEPTDPAGPPHPAVPIPAVDALVRRYLGPVRRAGRGLLPGGTPGGESAIYARAGFTGPERLVVPGGQPLVRDVDDAVAGVFSLSSSAPHLFGARRAEFETELRRLLRAASPTGRFAARQPGTDIHIWRRPTSPP